MVRVWIICCSTEQCKSQLLSETSFIVTCNLQLATSLEYCYSISIKCFIGHGDSGGTVTSWARLFLHRATWSDPAWCHPKLQQPRSFGIFSIASIRQNGLQWAGAIWSHAWIVKAGMGACSEEVLQKNCLLQAGWVQNMVFQQDSLQVLCSKPSQCWPTISSWSKRNPSFSINSLL